MYWKKNWSKFFYKLLVQIKLPRLNLFNQNCLPFSKKSVFFEVLFLLCTLPSSSLHPNLSDLLANWQEEDKVRGQEVSRPVIRPVAFLWYICAACFIGYSIGCGAMPVSGWNIKFLILREYFIPRSSPLICIKKSWELKNRQHHFWL